MLPGFWNLDSSLTKEFHITERKYFQFRWKRLEPPESGAAEYRLLPAAERGRKHRPGPSAGCSFGRITSIATDVSDPAFYGRYLPMIMANHL